MISMNTLKLQDAAQAVRRGRLVVYPTETFYAVGCSALDARAVERVYEIKRRRRSFALPVIIGSVEQLPLVAARVPEAALRLAEAFWPGPLTILLPVSDSVPAALSSGTGKVAVRVSSHPAAQALCLACGVPLVSSSANISGSAPVTSRHELDHALLAGVDGGIFEAPPVPGGGSPSSIVEAVLTVEGPLLRVLRQGAISVRALEERGFRCIPG